MSCPRVFSLALLAIAVLAVGPMAAASGQPPIFATLKHSGWKPVRSFPVAPGVRGWVFRVHGVYHIGYVIDGGRELAAGPLIGIRGQNLTPAFRRRYAPHISRRKLWREVTRTRHLAGPGHKTQPLYVFFDPNCIFCHRLFVQSRRWAKRGLRIEWTPGRVPEGLLSRMCGLDAACPRRLPDPGVR